MTRETGELTERELDAEIAEKIFSARWIRVSIAGEFVRYLWDGKGGDGYEQSACGHERIAVEHHRIPHYSTNAADSKALRDKLAEMLCGENSFFTLETYAKDRYLFARRDNEGATHEYAEAKDEFTAVAECAMLCAQKLAERKGDERDTVDSM